RRAEIPQYFPCATRFRSGWLVELGWVRAGTGEEFETGYRIYISGDTLMVDELKEIPKRLQGDKIDLMLVHLGGTTIPGPKMPLLDRKSTRLNSSHVKISY